MGPALSRDWGSRVPIHTDRGDDTVEAVLASGQDVTAALNTAIREFLRGGSGSQWAHCSQEIVVVGERRARGEGRDVAEAAACELRGRGQRARIARPPSRFERAGALVPGSRSNTWVSVDISREGSRLGAVRVLRGLTGTAIVAAIDLQGATSPIGLWSAYVHPLAGAAAGPSSSRSSLAADLALAFSPGVVLIGGTVGSLDIGVATEDLIAAELITVALRESGDDEAGPWENPLVQRATELEMGVTRPEQIRIVPHWAGSPSSPQSGAILALADRLGLRLGLPTS